MHGPEAVAYRAVITTVYPAWEQAPREADRVSRTRTEYAGPFGRPNEARAAITRAQRDARASRWVWSHQEVPPSPIVTGVVERTSLVWEVVE